MPAARWILPTPDSDTVAGLASALKLRPVTARVLVGRGFTDPDVARRLLRPSLDALYSPYLMAGMDAAVARLRRAIEQKEKILIYGDYDVDGTTSIVILKKAIELAGGAADFHVPHRLRDGYGMRTEVIERAAETGVKLIVSVDTGIRAGEVVLAARELGIDTIITDHHLPEAELPPAVAVLNPSRPDCRYPEKILCGAGVTFKLVQALLGSLGWPADRLERMLRSFLKLVAVATVADVVPLTGENRVIVKFGLDGLDRVNNLGLRALLEVSGLRKGHAPSAHQVAFQIAPRINAAGRMAHASDVIRLFLTTDLDEAKTLAEQLHALNQERQQTEAEIVARVLEQCELEPVTDSQCALVFAGANWHRGVVGIVASRLVERFCRPVFVLSEEDGELSGSGRSIPAFHLVEALESMPELFSRFGGHKQAAGLALPSERLDDFRTRLNAYAAARLTPSDFVPQLALDTTACFDELDDQAAEELLSLAPFGFGNPAPLLGIPGVQVGAGAAVLKERHLKVELRQNGRRLVMNGWNLGPRQPDLGAGASIDAVVSLEPDHYAERNGWGFWCGVLKDFRMSLK
ncbi:MAG TPA: single-stranded-DNA-specific exonuclease RecJ [Bryobacteraceae bacterium]|nr:single-stranded-DNA-specific exonuclease RecJ [Bryobacteraceae bacterium]